MKVIACLPSKWRYHWQKIQICFLKASFLYNHYFDYYFEDGKCRTIAEFRQLVGFILLFLIFGIREYYALSFPHISNKIPYLNLTKSSLSSESKIRFL